MRMGFGGAAAMLAAVTTMAPGAALADGLEFAGAGARGTMRGGAYVVGSTDAMALAYNPANLANTQGMQLHASLGLLFYSMCYNRDGTYGTSADGINRGGSSNASDQYGPGAVDTSQVTDLRDANGNPISFDDARDIPNYEVCNGHRVNVVPQLAYSWRINDRIGIGLGLVAPTAPANLSYGERIDGREGMVRQNGMVLPSPGRYMIIGQNALIAFPTIGIGVRVADRLRVGASFGWGFGSVTFKSMSVPFYSENFGTDVYAEARVHDAFIPRVSAGISGGPWQGVSFGANYTYYGDLGLSGTLDADSMVNYSAATRAMYRTSESLPAEIHTQLPWMLTVGARYASERRDVTLPEGAIGDSMDTENWNVELNLGFTRSSRVRDFEVTVGNTRLPNGYDQNLPPTDPANQALYPCTGVVDPSTNVVPGCVQVTEQLGAAIPNQFASPIRHNWKDQITLRLGGDYNVVPGRFSVSAGFSFDSNGQQRGYENLDFAPYRRFGLHAGFTVRVKRTDLFVAYAHHFNQTRTNGFDTACPSGGSGVDLNGDGDLLDPDEQGFCRQGQEDWGVSPIAAVAFNNSDVANSGRFRSSLDVLQVGLTYHIR